MSTFSMEQTVNGHREPGFYVPAAIVVLSFFYYLSYASYGFMDGDWGIILVAAERILQGKVFYQDFNIVYTPGIYLYTALAFKLFGVSLHTATVAWMIFRPFSCLLIYLVGIRFVPRRIAILLPLVLWLAPGGLHKSFFVFFQLLSLLIFMELLSGRGRWFYLFSGVIGSILFIFRIDLCIFFGMILLLVEALILIESVKNGSIISQITVALKNLSFFAGGVVIGFLPLAIYLFSNSAMDDFFNLAMVGVSTASPRWLIYRPLISEISSWTKWDFIHYAILFVPVLIYSLLFFVLVSDMIAGKFTNKEKSLFVLLIYGSMVTLSHIINGPGIGRLFLTVSPLLIAALYLLLRIWLGDGGIRYRNKSHLIYTVSVSAASLMLLLLIIAGCFTKGINSNGSIFVRFTNTTPLIIPPKVNVYTSREVAEEVNTIVDIIESTTEEDEYIFAITHYAMYYFVTGRRNPTRYDFTEAYQFSDEKQLYVVRELENKKVKVIIFHEAEWTNTILPVPEVIPIVYEYIQKHYTVKEKTKEKLIYIRDR